MADEKNEITDRLLALGLVQQAQIEILLELVEDIGKKGGITHVSGLPIRVWFEKKKWKS